MMPRAGGLLPFVALAALLHVAAFGVLRLGGEAAAGMGGDTPLTVVGGDPALAALVAEWQRPPEATPVPTPPHKAPPIQAPRAAAKLALPPLSDMQLPTQELQPEVPIPVYVENAATVPRPLARPDHLSALSPLRPQADRPTAPRSSQPEARAAVAAGTGRAAMAGAAGRAAVATGDAQAAARALAAWSAALQRALQRGIIVAPGLRPRREVRVLLDLAIMPDGRVQRARIARSSGNPALDRAALASVERLGRLPRAPEDLTAPVYPFEVPIVFEPA